MKQRINISLDAETREKLKELAAGSHQNVSQWITMQVWKEIKEHEKTEKRKKIKENVKNGIHTD